MKKSENMDNDVYSFALSRSLNEITNACPDIQSIFIFKKDGDIIGDKGKMQEEAAVHTVEALNNVLEKAEDLGGVQSITLDGNKGRVNVSRMNDFYLVTVVPEKADMKYINILTNVLVPTVLRLIEEINPALNRESPSEPESEEPKVKPAIKPIERSTEETVEKHEENKRPEASSERIHPEPQVNQFIVENIGGLFASTDTVRIDGDTISQWTELYEDERIDEVTIGTFGGKSVRCKLRPIKDSKYEGKGIIQIPEKIQQALEARKGELVRVKPVIE
jgi:predicted regulator of Ras-like GTPase activity (Roadblock/LC7/MglB family)